jgi:hypothetical protein
MVVALGVFPPVSASAEVKIAPYYSLQFAEGAAIPTKGDWMFAINLASDMGLIVQPSETHRFIGFYEIKYDGPGLRRQEGEKFTDRAMDHVIVLRHHYKLNEEYTLKSQIDYMTEYKRTGTNEIWGSGLYDFNRYGGALTLERKLTPAFSAAMTQQYHYMEFPNYTDLLAEFQAGGESSESSTGKQNHHLYQTDLALRYRQTKFSVNYVLMAYTKQKVVAETVQTDKTYYSGTLQRDAVLSFSIEHDRNFWNRLLVSPQGTVRLKSSNQNYQHFAVATSSVPVRYIGSYYDYNEFSVALPCSVVLNKRWDFFFNPEWDWKMYLNRPPRDADNTFLDGTQRNDMVIVSVGFTLKPNDITRTSFFYTYQGQSSNMKFEKYLPYNYSAHFFGVSFNYTY